LADPVARESLADGNIETTLNWSIAGRECSGTPDVSGRFITDLKVTADASPYRFPWHAIKMLWHGQLTWYGEARRIIDGHYPDGYRIVAVEQAEPHDVVVYPLADDAIEEGTKLWFSLFERLRACEEADSWPGYSQCPVPLHAPSDETTTLIIDGEEIEV